MLASISPAKARELAESGQARLVDIRETSEFAKEHVAGSRLVPLSVARSYAVKDEDAPKKPVIYFCQSGRRTQNNAELLEALADGEAYQIEGGLLGWKQAGLPVEGGSSALPMFRQVQIGAGLAVLLGVVGSYFWHPLYLLTAFVGAGLVFAGLTGFCGLAVLLAKMPWNKDCGGACPLKP